MKLDDFNPRTFGPLESQQHQVMWVIGQSRPMTPDEESAWMNRASDDASDAGG